MSELTIFEVVESKCLLGESPVWDGENSCLLWVDIFQKQIHVFYPATKEHRTVSLEKTPGCVALSPDGIIFAAVEDGFASVDLSSGRLMMLADVEKGNANNRFNDGKCDPAGRFWAGSMCLNGTPEVGNLYAMERDGRVSLKIAGVSCSNGMAWSSDHRTFYYIDTPTQQVVSFEYNILTGNLANKKIAATIPVELGKPDGMTIDAEGMLWVALWNGGKVVRINPETGKVIHQISLPASKITSCAFGGESLQDLYITSARTGLNEAELLQQPLAGSLFIIKDCGFKGAK